MLPMVAVGFLLLQKAVGGLQPVVSWGCKQLTAVVLVAIGYAWSWLTQHNSKHDQICQDVSKGHAQRMKLYEQIEPSNLPPLSVYAALATAHGVLDDLPASLLDADRPLLTAADSNYLGNGRSSSSNTGSKHSGMQCELLIVNNSTAILQAYCQEAMSSSIFVQAGQQAKLRVEDHLPEQFVVMLGGVTPDFKMVDFTARLDQRQAAGITVVESQGHFDFVPIPRQPIDCA